MIALVVNTKNEIRRVEYDPPHYDVIKEAVGGWYEHVHPMGLERPYSMMVNEEGLLLGLPMNRLGSELYGTPKHGQPIVGDIVFLKDGYDGGEPDVVGMGVSMTSSSPRAMTAANTSTAPSTPLIWSWCRRPSTSPTW